MGTTNVPEFSSSLSTESRLHGPCRNPWDTTRSTGGSSGGAAAAVAYGAVPIAYGNDSAGSIRVPSSGCGVFGLRPGRGGVPTGPRVGEIWYGLLSHHVITRTVRDSALVLDLTSGIDSGAPYGAPPPAQGFLAATAEPPRRLRVAVSDGAAQGFTIDARCMRALDDTANLLVELGHEVTRAAPTYDGGQLLDGVTTLLCVALAEEIPGIARMTGRAIGPDTVERSQLALYERGRRLTALELSRALAMRGELGRTLGRFFLDHDVLLTPTLAQPPIALGEIAADAADVDEYLARLWRYSPFAPLANVCGAPSMSVPLCFSPEGWPIGMMFTAPYAAEETLFSLAAELERARPWQHRHPPLSAWRQPPTDRGSDVISAAGCPAATPPKPPRW
jgi:amidase